MSYHFPECSTDIEFEFKQTLFGIVLMVRRATPCESPGMWAWTRWRKARFSDMAEYNKMYTKLSELPKRES